MQATSSDSSASARMRNDMDGLPESLSAILRQSSRK
jgi:hypothetical protein